MERFLRDMMEKLGGKVEGLVGSPSRGISAEDLISKVCRSLEVNLRADAQGLRRIVPADVTIAFSYEAYELLEEAALEAIRQELTTVVETYIQDHRYILMSPLNMKLICDPFLRQLFEVRVAHGAAAKVRKALWLVSERGWRVEIDLGRSRGRDRLSLGRSGDNDIVIDDSSVSRFHASLVLSSEGEVMVSDLGSSNGTYVNGERVVSCRIIQPQDELRIGRVPFRVEKG